jgi:NTE family protein
VPVAFNEGPIFDIMAASCSIPIVFHPVVIDGVRYVDGGVLRNMPSWIIRDNCDKLIGVNCSPLDNRRTKNSIFEIGLRTYNLMAKSNQAADMALCDLAVSIPEIASYKVFNLKQINQVYIRGYAATKKLLSEWLPAQTQSNVSLQ